MRGLLLQRVEVEAGRSSWNFSDVLSDGLQPLYPFPDFPLVNPNLTGIRRGISNACPKSQSEQLQERGRKPKMKQ